MVMGPTAPSVGRLEFEPVPSPWRWVIGAAPRLPPHWMLLHHGFEAARLVLLFTSDEAAKSEIGTWLDQTSRGPSSYLGKPVKGYIERTLHDLHVESDLSVGRVWGTPELFAWMHAVVVNSATELPREFADTTHDALVLPKRPHCPGQLALLRESRINAGITITRPRPLTWMQDPLP